LLFNYKNFDAGVAYDHFNEPNIGFDEKDDLPAKLTLNCNFQIKIDNNTNLTPGFIYQHQYSGNDSYLPSLMLKIWHIKLGIGTRLYHDRCSDDFIAMLGYTNNWISISYSYDVIIPCGDDKTPNKGTGGIHEITAVFKFNCLHKEKYGITQIYGF
jgi:hypothetical protein